MKVEISIEHENSKEIRSKKINWLQCNADLTLINHFVKRNTP